MSMVQIPADTTSLQLHAGAEVRGGFLGEGGFIGIVCSGWLALSFNFTTAAGVLP